MSDANEAPVLLEVPSSHTVEKNSCKHITIKAPGNEKKHTSGVLAVNTLTIKFQSYEV